MIAASHSRRLAAGRTGVRDYTNVTVGIEISISYIAHLSTSENEYRDTGRRIWVIGFKSAAFGQFPIHSLTRIYKSNLTKQNRGGSQSMAYRLHRGGCRFESCQNILSKDSVAQWESTCHLAPLSASIKTWIRSSVGQNVALRKRRP